MALLVYPAGMAEPDQLLDANNRKSRLSVMYTLAVAAQAGYLTAEPVPDFDSVDLTIKAGGSMRPSLDLQIKATSTLEWNDGEASFPLRRKNYDDLRCRRQNPIVLMVMEMPVDEARWIEFGAEALTLRRCAWWLSLEGAPEIETASRTVRLVENQRFDPDALRRLMRLSRERYS